MTETPAPATLPLHVGVGIATPTEQPGYTAAVIHVEVEGHTGAHRFEAQQRPGGTTWTLLATIPGLPPTILAPMCTLLTLDHAQPALTAFYRAAAAGEPTLPAAIAASGVPHQIDWTGGH